MLAPEGDRRRVFRLCWQHHHGGYDQGYLTTSDLLEAEKLWITEPENRLQPHPRDIALMRRVATGEIKPKSQWVCGDPTARSERARKAVVNRRQRSAAATGILRQPGLFE